MKKAVVVALVLLAACSKAENDRTGGQATQQLDDAQENKTGPDISVGGLAGMAVSYSYQFLLPIQQVAKTQEQHAAQCEALGPTKCRIVGLEYHSDPRHAITGSLSVKLAPEIARRYGRQGIETVVANGGMLSDSEITSTDAGATVQASQQAQASLSAEKARIAAQLAQRGLGSAERSGLQARVAQLNDQARDAQGHEADAALLLASTPLVFHYASGAVDPGFGDGPIVAALKDGWVNVVSGTAVLVTLLITLGPWAVVLLLLIWLWRRYLRAIIMGKSDQAE